ncbi:MAG: DnaJ domain-containing protein [Deltaproteobacteria bacterium]|jgi:curved DNA-binding protein CbpA|nr:DnaJ domain-containing protein [Deltaproteobacteria bacterium]
MKVRIQKDVDFYAILGLPSGAVQDDLRKAYLRLALKYHPDRNPGDRSAEERFKSISHAYAILSDPATRSRYDRLRRSKGKPKAPGTAKPRPGQGPAASSAKASAGPASSGAASSAKTAKPEGAAKGPTAAQGPRAAAGAYAEAAKNKPDPANQRRAARTTAYDGPRRRATDRVADEDLDDIMNDLFKTPEGKKSLGKVQEELDQAGLGIAIDKLRGSIKQAVTTSLGDSVKNATGRLLRRLKDGFFSSGNEFDPPEDIVFGLALSPEAAKSGATISISYLRDGKTHKLQVKIPAGVKDNSRLKISGQGHKTPDGRGDLHLQLSIQKPN